MTDFNHGAFIAELRKRRGKVPQDWYNDIMESLLVGHGKAVVASKSKLPWLEEARSHVGLKEVAGKAHNPKILQWVKKLGGWFTDDETPWCGTFVGYCMAITGYPVAKHWYRARDWETWGIESPPRVGAIVVFSREGGGHVGFLVGQSASDYYVLGGNQSNAVNITPIAKSRSTGIRWPASLPLSDEKLPTMTGGTVSRNEA